MKGSQKIKKGRRKYSLDWLTTSTHDEPQLLPAFRLPAAYNDGCCNDASGPEQRQQHLQFQHPFRPHSLTSKRQQPSAAAARRNSSGRRLDCARCLRSRASRAPVRRWQPPPPRPRRGEGNDNENDGAMAAAMAGTAASSFAGRPAPPVPPVRRPAATEGRAGGRRREEGES